MTALFVLVLGRPTWFRGRGRGGLGSWPHLTSGFWRCWLPMNPVGQPTPNIEHRTSNIEHRTSNIEHRTSNIEHRTPNGSAPGRRAVRSATGPRSQRLRHHDRIGTASEPLVAFGYAARRD